MIVVNSTVYINSFIKIDIKLCQFHHRNKQALLVITIHVSGFYFCKMTGSTQTFNQGCKVYIEKHSAENKSFFLIRNLCSADLFL